MRNNQVKNYLKEMRMHHYIKNLLVVVPLACSGKLFISQKILRVIFAFLAFCFISSAVYFINDLADAKRDRTHPLKRKRPIAAGEISQRAALRFTLLLIALSMLFNLLCFDPTATFLLIFYLLLNVGYSCGLKAVPILDIALLVSGFLIRALYGAIVTHIIISDWLYLVIISGAFYLVLGKRRNEYKKHKDGETRDVIKKYSYTYLDSYMRIFITLIFVFYALWTMDEKTIAVYHNSNLIWTVPFVMMIFMKYGLLIDSNSDGDPVEVLIHDKVLICMCFFYLICMFIMLYGFR